MDQGTSTTDTHAPAGRVEGWAGAIIDRGWLALALGSAIALAIAVWIPAYLRWPFWVDPDVFAVMARAWEIGVEPYRDIVSYNYPGQIYVFRVLEALFGPGTTAPFYAFDAGLVVAFGLVMATWGVRRLGRLTPALVGYLGFVAYYLNLAFDQVAQREWHAAVCVVSGLLAYQAWPDRRGRWASALGFAAGLTFRPHVVLFLPVILSAIDEEARARGGTSRETLRLGVRWGGAAVVCGLLAFAPLLWAGTLDDMVLALRHVFYNARYSELPPLLGRQVPRFVHVIVQVGLELSALKYSAVAALAALVAIRGDRPRARLVRTWVLAFAVMLLYKPMHPRWWVASLIQPLVLCWSVLLAVVAGAVLSDRSLRPTLRLGVTLLLMGVACDGVPQMVSLAQARQALLCRSGEPERAPLGYSAFFPCPLVPWDDYRGVLRHIRERTGPGTPVANLVFPAAINGPTGRPSPFRREGGVMWLHFVAPDEEAAFVDALQAAHDAVVVWEPSDDRLPATLRAAVRSDFIPEARFGAVEVARRRPSVASRR